MVPIPCSNKNVMRSGFENGPRAIPGFSKLISVVCVK